MAAAVSTKTPFEFNHATYYETPDLFHVDEEHKAHQGPSPYATKTTEGPSVLKEYKPLQKTGKLDALHKFTEVTPGLGREYYEDARLADILADKELLRELAITVSERGVVFFKAQDELTIEQQKKLALALAQASGAPPTSGLHIHPTALTQGYVDKNTNQVDPELLVLSSLHQHKVAQKLAKLAPERRGIYAGGRKSRYHSDITFEPVPAAYSVLRLAKSPAFKDHSDAKAGPVGGAGGDTLWASGYGLAETVSPSFLKYLETLTGTYAQPHFKTSIDGQEAPFYSAPRGAPENVGTELTAVHPVVRTNPVTGWKSIFAIGEHFTKFNGVTEDESRLIKEYLETLLYQSPEIQLRYRWDEGDIAIWDNRSTYHSIIHDLKLPGGDVLDRIGVRTLVIGERPFFDPESPLRTEALAAKKQASS